MNPLAVAGALHFLDGDLKCVVDRSFAAGPDSSESLKHVVRILREFLTDFDVIAEGDEEHFVLRTEREGDFADRLQRLLKFVPHAAAGIDEHTDAQVRLRVVVEKGQLLLRSRSRGA